MIHFCLLLVLWAGDVPSETERPLSCGQSSCYLLLSRLEREVTLEQIDPYFQDQKRESSLHDLQRVLGNFAVETVAWNVAWEDFQKIRGPMICHLAPSESEMRHFHVVEWRGGELWMLDPLAAHPIRIAPELFLQYRKSFSGCVLVPTDAVPWAWRLFGSRRNVWLGSVGIVSVIAVRYWFHRRRRPSSEWIAA